MYIVGPAHLHGPQPIGPPHSSHAPKPTSPSDAAPITDEVEISEAGRLVDQARAVPEIRQDRVDAIRVQIAEGTYETPEKLDTAVERLLDEIG